MRWRRKTSPAPEHPGWSWDHPPAGASVRGRTLIVEGWLAVWPDHAEIVVVHEDNVVACSRARHARPDVARHLGLGDDAVGFYLEADVRSLDPSDSVTVAIGVREAGSGIH